MIIYEFLVEDLEDGGWLFTTELLAKDAAESSMLNALQAEFGQELGQIFEFFWKDGRLHVKNMIPEATAYVVRERVLHEKVREDFW